MSLGIKRFRIRYGNQYRYLDVGQQLDAVFAPNRGSRVTQSLEAVSILSRTVPQRRSGVSCFMLYCLRLRGCGANVEAVSHQAWPSRFCSRKRNIPHKCGCTPTHSVLGWRPLETQVLDKYKRRKRDSRPRLGKLASA